MLVPILIIHNNETSNIETKKKILMQRIKSMFVKYRCDKTQTITVVENMENKA